MNAVAPSIRTPLIQHSYWNFSARDVAYRFPNQYYFGSSLVIAPVVSPRDVRTNHAKTKVWVPPRRHVEILTGSVYDGDRELDMYRPLKHIPILAPEGAIIPLDRELIPANGCRNPTAFEILVVVGYDGKFDILEDIQDDPGQQAILESQQRSISIECDHRSGRLTTIGADREWTFRFLSIRTDPSNVRVLMDGSIANDAQCSTVYSPYLSSTVVRLPGAVSAKSSITIELGEPPQLATMDYTKTISDVLVDYQIEIKLKDRLWDIIQTAQPMTVKIGRILSLGSEESVFGPLAELILSDSRSESVPGLSVIVEIISQGLL